MTTPSVNAMAFSLEELYALGALDKNGALVPGVGDLMAEFPVSVKFAKCIIESVALGCTDEMLSIAACSQVNNCFHFARSGTQKRERDLAVGAIVDNR